MIRREARRASKRRDRYLRRRKALVRELVAMGLLPESREEYSEFVRRGNDRRSNYGISPLDPYVLRCRGLRHRLEPYEIGRAIMHLARRRGRRSALNPVASHLPAIVLADRRLRNNPVRERTGRLLPKTGAKEAPVFSRQQFEREFQSLWTCQRKFHGNLLTEKAGRNIAAIIFHERMRKDTGTGSCSLVAGYERLARSDPLFCRFRVLKSLNELRVIAPCGSRRKLSLRERSRLCRILKRVSFLGFDMARRISGQPACSRFSTEVPGSTGIQGEVPGPLNPMRGRCRYSSVAIRKITIELERAVISEAEAIAKAGYDQRTKRIRAHSLLPHYSKVLRHEHFADTGTKLRHRNDTIHVALNQLRRVCNRLIARYGKPSMIALESGHDIKSRKDERLSLNLLESRRVKLSRERSLRYHRLCKTKGIEADTKYNRLKFRLWEELSASKSASPKTVYTGNLIPASLIFGAEIEIDHIRAVRKTAVPGRSNMILSTRTENRQKRNRDPRDVVEWSRQFEQMRQRARHLPDEKRICFDSSRDMEVERDAKFPARHLGETRRLSALAESYLSALFHDSSKKVVTVPGRLTVQLRRAWGIGTKPDSAFEGSVRKEMSFRYDHRSHALDAMIVGLAAFSRKLPWQGFQRDMASACHDIIVSHKPDHGRCLRVENPSQTKTCGKLHNATAYGQSGLISKSSVPLVVWRKPFLELKPKDVCKIRDVHLRGIVNAAMASKGPRSIGTVLLNIAEKHPVYSGIRRVRLIAPAETIIVGDRHGRPIKGYRSDSNHHADVWQLPDGKWITDVVSMWSANSKSYRSPIPDMHHNPKKVLRLFRNDIIAINDPDSLGETRILRVVKFSRDGRISFADHRSAGNLKSRDGDPADPFKYRVFVASTLKKLHARQIRVDEIGTLFDPKNQYANGMRRSRPDGRGA